MTQTVGDADPPGQSGRLNLTTEYLYDDADRLASVTDPLDRTTTYAYNAANLVDEISAPGNIVTAFAYDDAGSRTSATRDPGGLDLVTAYEYDTNGRVVATTVDPGGGGHLNLTATTEYDLAGHVTRATSPGGVVTAYAYDLLDRVVETRVDPGSGNLNLTTAQTYDAAGRLTTVNDPNGNETAYVYDAAGRLVELVDAVDERVLFTYDAAGRLVSLTNARGKTTSFEYDELGSVTEVEDPLDRVSTAEYDLLGRITSATDARDVTVDYAYDGAGRLTEIDFPAVGGAPAGSVETDHDALDRRTAMTDPTGTSEWSYDAAGRVEEIATPQGTVGYGYDAAGRRASLTLPGNDTVDYEYDAASRLVGLTDWEDRETTFGYDDDGRRTAILRPNGVDTALSYDPAGRLGMVEHARGATMLQRFAYELDDAGNRTKVTASGDGSGSEAYAGSIQVYDYDDLHRLVGIEVQDLAETTELTVELDYDPNGNRTGMTTTVPGENPVVAGYDYDDADQLTDDGSLEYAYDQAGNLVEAGDVEFAWDWAGRLASAEIGSTTTDYAYDGDGVRVERTDGQANEFLWDRAGGLPLLIGQGNQSYLHAGGVFAGIDGGGDATFALADGLGTVRGRTDDGGGLVGWADYDAFGVPTGSSGTGGTFGFAGEQTDGETGLVYLRARMYAPGLSRFLSRDSVTPNAPGSQGYNRYAYAANNPTTWTDPSGQAVGGGLGAAIGGVFWYVVWVLQCARYGECYDPSTVGGGGGDGGAGGAPGGGGSGGGPGGDPAAGPTEPGDPGTGSGGPDGDGWSPGELGLAPDQFPLQPRPPAACCTAVPGDDWNIAEGGWGATRGGVGAPINPSALEKAARDTLIGIGKAIGALASGAAGAITSAVGGTPAGGPGGWKDPNKCGWLPVKWFEAGGSAPATFKAWKELKDISNIGNDLFDTVIAYLYRAGDGSPGGTPYAVRWERLNNTPFKSNTGFHYIKAREAQTHIQRWLQNEFRTISAYERNDLKWLDAELFDALLGDIPPTC